MTIGPQLANSTVSQLNSVITLKLNTDAPLAGRDISFTLQGLDAWQEVGVEFIDPLGQPADWITKEEVHIVQADGTLVTKRKLFADASGEISWLRVGTQDQEGAWNVEITIDGRTTVVTYSVSQLQLQVEQETLGVELRRYQGLISNTLMSSLVPAALAVDLQSHLGRVVQELRERLGVQSASIPNIYLAGNRPLFQQLAQATGIEVGFEPGYYLSGGFHPGIYMRTDDFLTEVQGTLTHEYVHLAMDELALDEPLPAWLTEGLAQYYEYEIGLLGIRPDATKLSIFYSTDEARSAANAGALMPLPSLESLASWNSQTDEDRISLQYSEAYMAVRFLIETHGADAAADVVRAIGRRFTLATAIQNTLGISYPEFEQRFVAWLTDWEDPKRAEIALYIETLEGVLSSAEAISQRRAVELGSATPLVQRIPFNSALHSDAQALENALLAATPPESLAGLHQEALTYLDRYVQWLALQLEFVETGVNAIIIESNGMIEELNVREFLLSNEMIDVKYIYNFG
ncbi:MAG: hypothetical protein IIC97_12015 [Chloroflexi bacterium]|nr:hypothetical protein [Chloroflexota bacterium]